MPKNIINLKKVKLKKYIIKTEKRKAKIPKDVKLQKIFKILKINTDDKEEPDKKKLMKLMLD